MSIDEPVSRREFLARVGKVGLGIGLGAALGGLAAACDESGVATNTTATIAPGETTTTTEKATTTTVTTGPELGRPLRIGLVTAKSGPLALFGKADEWWMAVGSKAVRDGVVCGDGKVRAVTFATRDCRSDPTVAAPMAADLITKNRVDIILCSGDSGIVNGVAGEAEALGCPCLADFVPWQSFVYGRGGAPETEFKWTYAHAFGFEDLAANYLAMWGQLATNLKAGLVLPDDTDGRLWGDAVAGLPAAVAAAGYECVVPGLYAVGTPDFAPYVTEFQKNGCEICCCVMSTADFAAFWGQAAQAGYRPKIVTVGRGLLFPYAMASIGSEAVNFTAECLWQPDWPYQDSLASKSARELATSYETETGGQWSVALAQYAKFEWAVDVFRRAESIIDKEEVIARVKTTKLNTCRGPIDFTIPVTGGDALKSRRPAANVFKAPVGGVQWVAADTFDFEPKPVANAGYPALDVAGAVQPMLYEL